MPSRSLVSNLKRMIHFSVGEQTVFRFLVRARHFAYRPGQFLLAVTFTVASAAQLYAAIPPVSFDPRTTTAAPVPIRVRIAADLPSLRVRGYDLEVYRLAEHQERIVRADRMSEWEFSCQEGSIRAQEVRFLKNGQKFQWSSPLLIRTPVGFLQFQGRPYREEIRVYAVGSHCEVVNHLSLEHYLNGLVNSEFSSRWNEEAIGAQVVVARTYAYYQIQEAKKQQGRATYDLDATVKDQVYDGSVREDYHASRAIQKTQGYILTSPLTSELLQPIKAFYHSTCGGRTELPENVWGSTSPGFKKSVACPFCTVSPRYKWDLSLKDSEIADSILKGLEGKSLPAGWSSNAREMIRSGSLVNLVIKKSDARNRVAEVGLVWLYQDQFFELPVSAVRLRDWLGTARLRSTQFQITSVPHTKQWKFIGQGNGHGVGMCQWGAKVMGDKGYRTEAILKYYYPDAVLRKVW